MDTLSPEEKNRLEKAVAFLEKGGDLSEMMPLVSVLEEIRDNLKIMTDNEVDITNGIKKTYIQGVESVVIKGEKGDSPTDEHLTELIKPLIPKPLEGKKGDDSTVPGPKGDKGDSIKGDDGYTPIKGVDYVDGEKGKDGSPDTPSQVRDKLESLLDGEKLSIQAIQDLAKILESLEKNINSIPRGGGVRVRFVDDLTPTGTVNGSTTVFTIPSTKSPEAGSLKVYVNGQRMRVTEDYTLSGKTITFLTAPPTGSILLVDFRY